MTLDTAKEKVNQQLSTMEGELIGLMEGAINTPSPPGYEKEVCEYLAGWMNERDIDAHVQDIEPTRGNVVGRLSGTGGGKSVTFNAHMDTTFVGTEEDDLPIVGKVENVGRPQARLEDGLIYGLGAFNDKGPFVCACIAAHAIKKSGVTLQGDVLLAGVGGEIGRGQIGNLKGPGSRGKGIGSYYLLHFGEWTDYAIVCEGSNWSVSWALAGAAYFRITSRGEATYAPFNEHGAGPPSEDPNANRQDRASRAGTGRVGEGLRAPQRDGYPLRTHDPEGHHRRHRRWPAHQAELASGAEQYLPRRAHSAQPHTVGRQAGSRASRPGNGIE